MGRHRRAPRVLRPVIDEHDRTQDKHVRYDFKETSLACTADVEEEGMRYDVRLASTYRMEWRLWGVPAAPPRDDAWWWW